MSRAVAYHIDKVYFWDPDEGDVAVAFKVVTDGGDVLDSFSSYTKAEQRIVELLEKANA